MSQGLNPAAGIGVKNPKNAWIFYSAKLFGEIKKDFKNFVSFKQWASHTAILVISLIISTLYVLSNLRKKLPGGGGGRGS